MGTGAGLAGCKTRRRWVWENLLFLALSNDDALLNQLVDPIARETAVFFLTHKWNRLVRLKVERLMSELDEVADVFVLMQKPSLVRSAVIGLSRHRRSFVIFDKRKLPDELGYPYFAENSITPGSTHFPLIRALINENYAHAFMIESDVEFSGNWRDLVLSTLSSHPDFASLHFYNRVEKPDWAWWESHRPGVGDLTWALDPSNLRRSFNPVFCLSKRGAHLIHQAHQAGWSGHQEVLFATLLSKHGCRLVDLANLGFCVGAEQDHPEGEPIAAASTVRWRPAVTPEEFNSRSTGRTLFHPVKGRWFFDGKAIVSVR